MCSVEHQCVINVVLLLNPKHQLLRRKLTMQDQGRGQCPSGIDSAEHFIGQPKELLQAFQQHRKANGSLLLNGAEDLRPKGVKKAEVLNAFFTSVYWYDLLSGIISP